jgi:uncharacterized protein YndB with AHSA1/START domain
MPAEDLTALRIDQYYAHPPARVWTALTDPTLMAEWLMPNDFRAVLGHRFTLEGTAMEQANFSGVVACQVLELQPLERLRISWRDAHNPAALDSTVTFDLHAEGHGTRLVLEHRGFDPNDPGHQIARRILGSGWRSHVLRRLADLLGRDRPI